MSGRRLILKVDSLEVISTFDKGFVGTNEVSNVFYSIIMVLKRDWLVRVQHIYMKGNMVAN